ncbi:hypothetical protein DR864_07310 [Runella rosea]|uniref:Uncharacterized protein n=1 Tax=Runella rosea TaxID=2259595 RepID=A0A344TFY1_9BACT|nr:hypothetical protein [Runella rosea]AXE17552.1 hypothetical protein DR864_07310 [Runella rosea]
MKSFIQSFIVLILLGSSSVLAQNSSINSPHNYKRPVSQKAPESASSLVVSSNERVMPLELKNNVQSAHNYKRQGKTNFAQEATVVMSVPTIGLEPQNPLVLPNHYKSQAKPAQVDERVARKAKKTNVQADSLSR